MFEDIEYVSVLVLLSLKGPLEACLSHGDQGNINLVFCLLAGKQYGA